MYNKFFLNETVGSQRFSSFYQADSNHDYFYWYRLLPIIVLIIIGSITSMVVCSVPVADPEGGAIGAMAPPIAKSQKIKFKYLI